MTLHEVVERVDYWQHHPSLSHLGLAHWRFQVQWIDECSTGGHLIDGAVGLADTSDFYSDAFLAFSEEEMTSPQFEDDQDRYIVHELLHVAWRDLDEAEQADIEDFLPPPLAGGHQDRVRHAKEGLLDSLARTIVSLDRRTQENPATLQA